MEKKFGPLYIPKAGDEVPMNRSTNKYREKKGVPAHSLTNFSRNSPTFPHSITNKEGGNAQK